MDMRHPVRSLTWALTRALEQDLMGVESALANDLMRHELGHPITRRPTVVECSVVMFTQTWTAGDLGFDDPRGHESIDAETVVVTGPSGDACVYASTQLLYKVGHPNRTFFLDVAGQRMRGKGDRGLYDGRDSADMEAFDYEAAGALARVCGAATGLDAEDAARVSRMLQAYVERLEAIAARVREQALGTERAGIN
jgi:hypothetical protein